MAVRYGVTNNFRYFIGFTKEFQGLGFLVSFGGNKNFKRTITIDLKLLWFSMWAVKMFSKRKKVKVC